jgi:hypothetical protein
MNLTAVTYAERPDLRRREDVDALFDVWPEFLLHDAICNAHFGRVRDGHPEFQILLLDGDVVIAEGNTIPVAWDRSRATSTGPSTPARSSDRPRHCARSRPRSRPTTTAAG